VGFGNAMRFGMLAYVLSTPSLGPDLDHGPEADHPNFVVLSNQKKVKWALVLLLAKEPSS